LGEGLRNPCLGRLPGDLARHDLVLQAFDGIAADALWDTHCHLLGTGDSGSGCTVNAAMTQWWHPAEVVRERMILNAACVAGNSASIDHAYVQGLLDLTDDFPTGARWLLFAFDHACDERGQPVPEWTTFQVPNAYAAQIGAAHPERFAWVASVHPYREDAIERLDAALAVAERDEHRPARPALRRLVRSPRAQPHAAHRPLRRGEGSAGRGSR
jgi:mannonate dehydratase